MWKPFAGLWMMGHRHMTDVEASLGLDMCRKGMGLFQKVPTLSQEHCVPL